MKHLIHLAAASILLSLLGGCAQTATTHSAPAPTASQSPPPPVISLPAPQASPAELWEDQNEAFMREVATRPGVQCTASGLCYEQKVQGIAAPPSDRDSVVIHYRQTLFNGDQIDSSYERGVPSEFPTEKTITGFVEALKLMKAPATFKFYIPSSLAFSVYGAGTQIPPNSVLVLDVELLNVKRAK